MIALDTNALVRILVEDDLDQAKIVQDVIREEEGKGRKILVLSEVLMEAVWVLESVYQCERIEIADFLDALVATPAYHFPDYPVVQEAVRQYREKGDFADLIIIGKARKHHAKMLFSFDKNFQKMFPDFVADSVRNDDKATALKKALESVPG